MYLRSFALAVTLFSTSVFAQALAATVQYTNVDCFGASTGSARAIASGGTAPYSYAWTTGATTASIVGVAAGAYTVTVRDSVGATVTGVAIITQPTQISLGPPVLLEPVTCNGGGNARAQALSLSGGTGGFTYLWSPGGQTTAIVSGLRAGTHTVTATDANSCAKSRSITISEPAPFQVNTTQTDVTCFGANDGRATVNVTGGGTPGYTYSWAPSGGTAATASALTPGNYTVTITDANLCQTTRTVGVTQPSAPLTATAVATNLACFGVASGAIDLTPAGGTAPYGFDWGGGVTTEDRSGLTAGTYAVAITDARGCTASRSATLTQPASALSGAVVATPTSCFGGSNGRLDLTASGGTAPLAFDWGNGVTTEDRTGLPAGAQSVVITDANACSVTVNATVTQPPELVITAGTQTSVSCHGGNDGSLTVSASGGTGVSSYQWSGAGGSAATASALAAGSHTVTATDENLCTATRSLTISEPATLVLQTSKQDTCPGESSGSASVRASGGTAPYGYDWSPGIPAGEGTSSISALGLGGWSVSVVDSLGCQAAGSVTVADRTSLPQAQAQSLTTSEDTALAVTLGAGDSCGTPTFAITAQPRHGALSGTAPAVVYTPEGNYFGADDFAFTVTGSTGTSAAATVSIAVTAVNDLPVAHAQTVSTSRDTPVAITLTGSDVEGTSLTFAIVDQPLHGALSGTAPALTYAPMAGFVGDDVFTFRAHDGTDSSVTATVSIIVEGLDAGLDAGSGDAGLEDAGISQPSDAGTQTSDGGNLPGDAGVDAGVDPMPPLPNPVGCGCTAPPGAMLAWSLGVLLLRRRRAR